jgi:hypothetical protein
LAEYLRRKRQEVKDMPTMNESDTYKSTRASSNSSNFFSEVGWKICMSKYFTKKGKYRLIQDKESE